MGSFFGEGSPGVPVDTGSGSSSSITGTDPWLDFGDAEYVEQNPGSKIAVLPVSLAGAGDLSAETIDQLTVGVYKTVTSGSAFTAFTHAYLYDTRDNSLLADQINTGFSGDAVVQLTPPDADTIDALLADALAIGVAFDSTSPSDPAAVARWKQTWYDVQWSPGTTPGPWLDAEDATQCVHPRLADSFDLVPSYAYSDYASNWTNIFAGTGPTSGAPDFPALPRLTDQVVDGAGPSAEFIDRYTLHWTYPPVTPPLEDWPAGAVDIEFEDPAGTPVDTSTHITLDVEVSSTEDAGSSGFSLLRVPVFNRADGWYDPASQSGMTRLGGVSAPGALSTVRSTTEMDTTVDDDDDLVVLGAMDYGADGTAPQQNREVAGIPWEVEACRVYTPPRYRFIFVADPFLLKLNSGTFVHVGRPTTGETGVLKLKLSDETWVKARGSEDATPGVPLKLKRNDGSWVTVAVMIPDA